MLRGNWWIQTPLLVLRWNWPCQKCLESFWLCWKTDSGVLYLQFKYVAVSVWCLIALEAKQHARVDGKWGEAWISISHKSVIKWLLQSWSALISCCPSGPNLMAQHRSLRCTDQQVHLGLNNSLFRTCSLLFGSAWRLCFM